MVTRPESSSFFSDLLCFYFVLSLHLSLPLSLFFLSLLPHNLRFQEEDDEELKYLPPAKELIRPERNTLLVSFHDVEEHSTKLANLIQEHYYQLVTPPPLTLPQNHEPLI